MTDAPERIWVVPDMDDVPRRHWDCGVWRDDKQDAIEVHGGPVVEYVRADLSTFHAGFRAGLEAAAKVAEERHDEWSRLGFECEVEDDISACADIAAAIRAIPVPEPDPVAELVRAAKAVLAKWGASYPTAEAMDALRAALAKMEGRG